MRPAARFVQQNGPMHRAPLAAALLVVGCAVEPSPELGSDQAAIVNGQLATGDPAVVALTTRGQQFCTGTVVAPRVVVTAAHCLPPNIELSTSAIEIFFGNDVDQGGTFIAATIANAHESWTIDAIPNDIGLVALSEDAPVTPMAMIATGEPAAAGEQVRLVGFGITEANGGDNGVKREGTGTIASADASTIYLAASPSLTCNGDSGGPMFVDRGGQPVFAGIHSRSNCTTDFLNERVDVHLDSRISPFIAANGGGTCLSDGVCDEDCAADPDCGGGGGGGVPADLIGGCAAGRSSPIGLAGLAILAGLAAGRRRGERRQR
jgi:V8-like Glu-specific endopeptidase